LTVKEIMGSMVEPSANALWNSVATNVTDKGPEVKAPQNDEQWGEIRKKGVTLVEAMNLIVMDGRHMAPAGVKSDNPNIELAPEQIQELVDKDHTSWIMLAHGQQDAAFTALKAIDTKDTELSNAGGDIDAACEACHVKSGIRIRSRREKARAGVAGKAGGREGSAGGHTAPAGIESLTASLAALS
jgi:predicted metallo-beta-lactamase superfamily hydrolase